MSSLNDLLAQHQALENQIAEIRAREREGAIAQVKALLTKYGLTVDDIARTSGLHLASEGSSRRSKVVGLALYRARPAKTLAPKYRDPDSGATWSGQGPRPFWLLRKLEAGHTLESLAI
jgi:DNA-binding protein H-NS